MTNGNKGPTELGGKYDDGPAGIHNIGHGFVSCDDNGIVIGRLDYPGPNSGGVSAQQGDCSAIIEQMPWIVGPGNPVDDGTHKPLATTDTDGKIATAGWMRPFDQWTKPDGQVATAPAWSWVGTDGEIGTAPGGDNIAAARKALADALDRAQAAASILAAAK